MGPIIRNLKSFSGALLMFTVMLIATLWIWNFLSSRNIPGASIVAAHLPGGAVASAPVVSPNSYHGL